MKALEFSMTKNERLGKYDLKHNNFSEPGLLKLTEILKTTPHVNDIEVPDKLGPDAENAKETFDAFRK